MCLPRRVLLHVLSGRLHCKQDASIRCYDHRGREDVAKDEERQSVRAGHSVLIGHAPVDAAGGAIRFWSIFSPVDQRGTGKQQGVDPSTGNKEVAMNGVKPVAC